VGEVSAGSIVERADQVWGENSGENRKQQKEKTEARGECITAAHRIHRLLRR